MARGFVAHQKKSPAGGPRCVGCLPRNFFGTLRGVESSAAIERPADGVLGLTLPAIVKPDVIEDVTVSENGTEVVRRTYAEADPASVADSIAGAIPRRIVGRHVLDQHDTAMLVKSCVTGIVSTGVPASDGWLVCGVDEATWRVWWERGVAELRRWAEHSPEAAGPSLRRPPTNPRPPAPPEGFADPAETPYAVLVWACQRASAVTETMAWSVIADAARGGRVTAAERLIDRYSERRAAPPPEAARQQAGSPSLVVSAEALNSLLDYFGGRQAGALRVDGVVEALAVDPEAAPEVSRALDAASG
jgi:hypothetical protein